MGLSVVVFDRVDLLRREVLVDRGVADLARHVVVACRDLLCEGHLHVPVDLTRSDPAISPTHRAEDAFV